MVGIIVKRVLVTVPLLLLVSFAVFSMLHLMPGDAASTLAGENASGERIEQVRSDLGLDEPLIVQYGSWLGDALSGDFGQSLYSGQDVWTLIAGRIPATLSLACGALVVSLLVGVPAAAIAALRPGGVIDKVVTFIGTVGIAVPSYFIGMILILFLAIREPVFPATGYTPFTDDPASWLNGLVLPSIALGASAVAIVTRQLRSALIEQLNLDYVRTARAKGLSEMTVLRRHVLRNAAIPVVTILAIEVAYLLGGAVVVETVFGIPGIGQLAVGAVTSRDFPTIQGVVLLSAGVVVFANFAADIAYGLLNPKIRTS